MPLTERGHYQVLALNKWGVLPLFTRDRHTCELRGPDYGFFPGASFLRGTCGVSGAASSLSEGFCAIPSQSARFSSSSDCAGGRTGRGLGTLAWRGFRASSSEACGVGSWMSFDFAATAPACDPGVKLGFMTCASLTVICKAGAACNAAGKTPHAWLFYAVGGTLIS